jgi:hypothetical protein
MERGGGGLCSTGAAAECAAGAAGGAPAPPSAAGFLALGIGGAAVSVGSAWSWILASSLDAAPPESDDCVKKSTPVLDSDAMLSWPSSCASLEGVSAARGKLDVDTACDPVPMLSMSGLRPIFEREGVETEALGGLDLKAAATHSLKSVP